MAHFGPGVKGVVHMGNMRRVQRHVPAVPLCQPQKHHNSSDANGTTGQPCESGNQMVAPKSQASVGRLVKQSNKVLFALSQ